MTMKLSEYVIQKVAEQGVKHVFMLPGGGAMHLNDALARCKEIEYVGTLHEQAAAIAAEAYARVTNNLGVALVTTGPGGTNAVTGIAGAYLDSTPCLFLAGQVKRADLKRDSGVRILGVQEIDMVSIVTPITKYAVTIMDPATIRYHLEKAIYLARSGRPGPVWVEFPLDVQGVQVDPERMEGFTPPPPDPTHDGPPLAEQVARAIAMLNEAERPVILAGNGIRLAGAMDEFLRVVERLNIPVLTTWLGLDLIPADHPLCFGRPGSIAPRGANFTLQNCDCLLAIGTRMDMALTAYAHDRLARAAHKIMVDIDPAEIRKMRTTIHLPVVADAGDFLRELRLQADKIRPAGRAGWIDWCQVRKEKYPLVLPEHRNTKGAVSMYHFSEVLSEELEEGDVIAPSSSGFQSEIFILCFQVKNGQRIFHNRGTGSMGFGLPASIGACMANGRRRTVSVDGDGGIQMNIQELATVVRLNLPIKTFVINNNGYASNRSSQRNYFNLLVGADPGSGLYLPDICKVAAAYGVGTARIDRTDHLREAIREVLRREGPVICEVVVPPDEERQPVVKSQPKADGSMVSKPLEDLWPFLPREEFLSNMLIPPVEE
jgi:acetolactate synthase-1/2/3 large subunit